MDQADILRILIIFLSLTAPLLIIVRNHSKRHRMNWGDVLIRLGVGVTFVAVAYSTAESFIQGLGFASRLYILLTALIWVNTGLLVSILYDRKMDRMHDSREEQGTTWI
jgi:hypothetical protein